MKNKIEVKVDSTKFLVVYDEGLRRWLVCIATDGSYRRWKPGFGSLMDALQAVAQGL